VRHCRTVTGSTPQASAISRLVITRSMLLIVAKK
jgi:hypothetical protein